MKNFIDINDHGLESLLEVIEQTNRIKKLDKKLLRGKNVIMLFNKPSTRTRVSFQVGINQLGGNSIFLNKEQSQMSKGESLKDTARVLGRYGDAIVARLFDHENMKLLAEEAGVPVINGLTDLLHPCQALSDIYTIKEYFGGLDDVKMTFIGDGNNVCHSLMHICSKLGLDLSVGTPVGFEPKEKIIENAKENYKRNEGNLEILNDPLKAVEDSNVIYTDVWSSMGDEKSEKEIKRRFEEFQVNRELLENVKDEYVVMHCLPAHRGQEITGEVLERQNSIVYQQAENRLHVQKALLEEILNK